MNSLSGTSPPVYFLKYPYYVTIEFIISFPFFIYSFLLNGKSNTLLIKIHTYPVKMLKNHATLKQNKIKSKNMYEMLCKINEDFLRYNLN